MSEDFFSYHEREYDFDGVPEDVRRMHTTVYKCAMTYRNGPVFSALLEVKEYPDMASRVAELLSCAQAQGI